MNVSPAARHGQLPIEPRPPFPPLSMDTATAKVPAAEDVWNTRDPDWVSRAFTVDSIWRNGDVFLQGREDERGPDHEIPLQ